MTRWGLLLALAACGDNTQPSHTCTDSAQDCRASCAYGAGAAAAETLADFPQHIPIDHVILVMQENRTFDHYFSRLAMPGQDIDCASPTASNPDPTQAGAVISRFHQTAYCFDNPAETWSEVHREVDGGAMDGFTAENGLDSNDPTGARAMGYYDETDLPYYYALARAFAISDRHFASVQANSWTNRLYYLAGTSYGGITNTLPDYVGHTDGPNLITRLDDAHVTWAFYTQDIASYELLGLTYTKRISHTNDIAQFFSDAAAGQLPQVTFVEASDRRGGLSPDEDPPADMQVGQAFVKSIVDAVTSSPQWPHAAVIISFDEQGGFYDHVPPQPACVPDDFAPNLGAGDVAAQFDQTGLRVPLLVVSPYAKRGYVSHVVTDHTSILRFVEARFHLPALTRRDANAVPPFDMFDFAHPDLSVPALPDAPIDAAQQSACAQKYP